MTEAIGQSSLAAVAATTTPAAPSVPAPANDASAQTPASPAGTSPTTPAPSSVAPSRPSYVPESHWDATGGKIKDDAAFSTYLNEILSRDAAAQSVKATLPQSADKYEIRNTQAFKVPDGLKFEIDQNNPLWSQAKAVAHEYGIPQEAVDKFVDLVAGDRLFAQQQFQNAAKAEVAKLGATAATRINAVDTFLATKYGEEGKRLASHLNFASDYALLERIMGDMTRQGAAPFNANGGREPPGDPRKVSDEQFAKMSAAERIDYARQFPQPTANGRAA